MENNFGEFLYELRKEKNLTQTELADLLGITNKAVSKWETGEAFPETAQLVPISNIFKVSVDELLRGKRDAAAENTAAPIVPETPMTKREAGTIVFSIALMLIGVLAAVVFSMVKAYETMGVNILLVTVAVGVLMLTQMGMKRDLLRTALTPEMLKEGKRSSLKISIGIMLVILSIIPLIFLSELGVSELIYSPYSSSY